MKKHNHQLQQLVGPNGQSIKKIREQSVKVSRFNQDKLAAHSVHEVGTKNELHARNSGHDGQMRKSVNELNLGNGAGSADDGQYPSDALSKDFTLNLANLTQVDEKLNALADCLKK